MWEQEEWSAKYNKSTVGISKDYNTIQNKTFILYQNFPNPFNPSTKIRFTILQGKSGNTIFRNASLKIYEITGKEISSLINQRLASGEYEIEFNSNNLSGGIYFYKLSVDDFIETLENGND